MFRVVFNSHGERAFGRAPRQVQEVIAKELSNLAADAQWYYRAKKLGGSENRYRLRIGRWRVLFFLRGKEIEVVDIFMKKGREDYRRRNT